MGLNVYVYKNPLGDFTNNGISKGNIDICLVNIEGGAEPSEYSPAAMLVKGNISGMVKIVPAYRDEHGEYQPVKDWTMMGGNYAASSDFRFHEAVEKITNHPSYGAVPIHDRIEN